MTGHFQLVLIKSTHELWIPHHHLTVKKNVLSLLGLANEVEETVAGEMIFSSRINDFLFWLSNLDFCF